MKRMGMVIGILKIAPKRYQDPVLWAWLEIFSPLRGTRSETTLTDTGFFQLKINLILLF